MMASTNASEIRRGTGNGAAIRRLGSLTTRRWWVPAATQAMCGRYGGRATRAGPTVSRASRCYITHIIGSCFGCGRGVRRHPTCVLRHAGRVSDPEAGLSIPDILAPDLAVLFVG